MRRIVDVMHFFHVCLIYCYQHRQEQFLESALSTVISINMNSSLKRVISTFGRRTVKLRIAHFGQQGKWESLDSR